MQDTTSGRGGGEEGKGFRFSITGGRVSCESHNIRAWKADEVTDGGRSTDNIQTETVGNNGL